MTKTDSEKKKNPLMHICDP